MDPGTTQQKVIMTSRHEGIRGEKSSWNQVRAVHRGEMATETMMKMQTSQVLGKGDNVSLRVSWNPSQRIHSNLWCHNVFQLHPFNTGTALLQNHSPRHLHPKGDFFLTSYRCFSFPEKCPNAYYFSKCWVSCHEICIPGLGLVWYKKLEQPWPMEG